MFSNIEIFWKTFGGDKLLKCMGWLSHGISYSFGSLNMHVPIACIQGIVPRFITQTYCIQPCPKYTKKYSCTITILSLSLPIFSSSLFLGEFYFSQFLHVSRKLSIINVKLVCNLRIQCINKSYFMFTFLLL